MPRGFWLLVNDSSDDLTKLVSATTVGPVISLGTPVELPEPLTRVSGSSLGSTAAIASLPYNPAVVYIAGRSDTTGEFVAWRYDHDTETFDELMREETASGTWPFAIKLWPNHTPEQERVYLAIGNGSAWGVFSNQNPEHPQGVWVSDGASNFFAVGIGHEWSYSGANINHPNSLTDLYVVEAGEDIEDDILATGHTVTRASPFAPNTWPFWSVSSATVGVGGDWKDNPHATGLNFSGGWQTALNRLTTDPTTAADGWLVTNGGGAGPRSFFQQNFGVPNNPVALSTGTPGGSYRSNARCIVFPDVGNILLAFGEGDTGELVIDRYSPVDGTLVNVFTDVDIAAAPSTAIYVSVTGGIAACLTDQHSGAGCFAWSFDYGSTWTTELLDGYAGMALDAGPTDPSVTAPVYEETLIFQDSRGFDGQTRFCIAADTSTEARDQALLVTSLLVALSNGHFVSATGPYTTSPVLPIRGADFTYQNIETVIRLVWTTEDGIAIPVEVPCPTSDLFLDDQETVAILSTALIDAAAGALENYLCTRGGKLATQWMGASRIMRGLRRRLTVGNLDPNETGTGL